MSLSDSQKPAEKPAEPPKPQPTQPNPACDPEFRKDPGCNPPARSSRHATWEADPRSRQGS